ncbi:hypothetical protein B0H16DRAFT_1467601 [Mycena metata]|uniref:Uncharacterized protein n=1 Tax=Mycena metata TaxID=1033252 RepID=A0AAD7MVG6_9AGAR|nr:hypothetical protein B0H16DRAFT_1467601 [Mycena metata]
MQMAYFWAAQPYLHIQMTRKTAILYDPVWEQRLRDRDTPVAFFSGNAAYRNEPRRDRDPGQNKQRNGAPVTVTVAPIQGRTVREHPPSGMRLPRPKYAPADPKQQAGVNICPKLLVLRRSGSVAVQFAEPNPGSSSGVTNFKNLLNLFGPVRTWVLHIHTLDIAGHLELNSLSDWVPKLFAAGPGTNEPGKE